MRVRPASIIRRSLIVVHRWLGVALCIVMLLWFPSGIGMMYWRFPTVTEADRIDRAPALDPTRIRLSLAEASTIAGTDALPEDVQLATFDGRPAYRFYDGAITVYADTGEQQGGISRDQVARAAEAWTGQAAGQARVEEVRDIDQWTIQLQLFDLRPLWKYSWPNGEEVYVSGATGEVVQHTTTASRVGAYLGPITHWFYFTPIRTRPEWLRFMIWSSGIGTIAALIGIVLGVWMYSPSRRYRHRGEPTAVPYVGQKRLHTILGLIFGVATVTWAFSGMLSLDPFPSLDRGPGRRGRPTEVLDALRGPVELSAFLQIRPRQVVERLGGAVKAVTLTSFDGQPLLAAHRNGRTKELFTLEGQPVTGLDHGRIASLVGDTADDPSQARASVVEQYDLYYRDRARQQPLPVLLVQLHDRDATRYYIDPRTGDVVGGYSSKSWVGRWLYNGLHSLDFPWLYNYRPLWDIVVIAFMLGGTALCVTSLVLAWRALGRTLTRPWVSVHRRTTSPA